MRKRMGEILWTATIITINSMCVAYSLYIYVITVIGNISTIEWAAKVYYFCALWRNVETRVIKSFRRITITTAHST